MVITIDIDSDLIEKAQSIALSNKESLGKVISTLLRQNCYTPAPKIVESDQYRHGFRLLPPRGEIITPEHIRRLMDEGGI